MTPSVRHGSSRGLRVGGPDAGPDVTVPGALRPGEDPANTRQPPSPLPADILKPGLTKPKKPNPLGYGVFRATQGPSGTWHWGLDIPTPTSVAVVAPERCAFEAAWFDNATAPFVGYGPAGVLLRGMDTGVFHLLGHLDPTAWSQSGRPTKGRVYDKGEQVGLTAPAGSDGVGAASPHVHWEVRVTPIDNPSTRQANTLNPLDWLAGVHTTMAQAGASEFPWWIVVVGLVLYGRKRR